MLPGQTNTDRAMSYLQRFSFRANTLGQQVGERMARGSLILADIHWDRGKIRKNEIGGNYEKSNRNVHQTCTQIEMDDGPLLAGEKITQINLARTKQKGALEF